MIDINFFKYSNNYLTSFILFLLDRADSEKLLRVKFYNKLLLSKCKFCFFIISAPRDLII